MAILSIETATEKCSVALHYCNGIFIAQKNATTENAHSELLGSLIEELLYDTHIPIQSLKAIAISQGPGSYTGLRIGTSLAKGMCFALSIPLIAVDTLQALALSIKEKIEGTPITNGILTPMIDARRMEIYTAQWNIHNKQIQATNACIVDNETCSHFSEKYHYYIGGNGSDKCTELLYCSHIQHVANVVNQAKTVGDIACQLYAENKFVNCAYFEPLYLKEFQTTHSKKLL
ncbi:MAG: tRNA (adenosine(37)-N6)-threonylcarbamoyltransferase complex dimerization subunit type 1 TsaB [Bacteroidales bacterium]|jgi:tRNA threonylcarbamoyladenosine biosynthesis protein TsaB|nr:tRNA (adenosine(37)-N6)-threonylcarbamoyltransferase complex dimerization subunit type 1 TsaB [Bacteroidales bacterium]